MATKRKYAESDPLEAVHASRQFQVYGTNQKPAKKPRRSEKAMHKQPAHTWSVNAIKKRIRDISRRLERGEGLPADVRMEDERALAAYQQELASAAAEKTRQKMIKKYHMVRFFERKKASRQLKKLRKRLLETQSPEEVEALTVQTHMVEVDLNYTQFFPLSEPYISLYPQNGSAADGDDLSKVADAKLKPPMWVEVEKCMAEGTLSRLRNRIPDPPAVVLKPLERSVVKPEPKPAAVEIFGLNRRERRRQLGISKGAGMKNKSMDFTRNQTFEAEQSARRDQADDGPDGAVSDGGFFEE